jgi:hypothetical protein
MMKALIQRILVFFGFAVWMLSKIVMEGVESLILIARIAEA